MIPLNPTTDKVGAKEVEGGDFAGAEDGSHEGLELEEVGGEEPKGEAVRSLESLTVSEKDVSGKEERSR